jgi:ribonucleotide monophosphatase NagD (HAD superfamily)
LLGYDTGVTYRTLTEACLLVARGLPYYATHADRTCISPRGLLPDAGALIAAIEVTTGRTPVVLGKPEASMVEAGLRRLGTRAEETLILGDQLDTDMMLGQRSGIFSVLTMTGEAARRRREYESVTPDLTVAHPGELLERLRAAGALP